MKAKWSLTRAMRAPTTSRYHSAAVTWSRTEMEKCRTPLVLIVSSSVLRSFSAMSPSCFAMESSPCRRLGAAVFQPILHERRPGGQPKSCLQRTDVAAVAEPARHQIGGFDHMRHEGQD